MFCHTKKTQTNKGGIMKIKTLRHEIAANKRDKIASIALEARTTKRLGTQYAIVMTTIHILPDKHTERTALEMFNRAEKHYTLLQKGLKNNES